MLESLIDQFQMLVRNLTEGNQKRARILAARTRRNFKTDSLAIVSQNFIEEMAQNQALKNAFVNSPSFFPGVGTILSFWLLGIENFLMLDQGITLILALCVLHDLPIDDTDAMVAFSMQVIAEAYKITNHDQDKDLHSIARNYLSKVVSLRYLNKGLNKGLNRLVLRFFPRRRVSRLLPAGFGIAAAAIDGYDILVRVGQISLKNMHQVIPQDS